MTVRARSGPASIASHRRIGATTAAGSKPLVRPQVRDDEQRRPLQPVAAEPVQEVTAHRRQRRRRDPVEHHRDGRTTLDGALQHPPRQRVAVAGSGRHEEPQVSRLEQPVRGLPVRLQHRVEVRGVQQRDPARHLLVGDDRHGLQDRVVRRAAPRRAGCAPAPAAASSAAAPPPCSPPSPPTSSPASTCPHRSSPRSPRPPVPRARSGAGRGAHRAGRRAAPATPAPTRSPRSPAGTRCAPRRGAGPGPRRAATSPPAGARGHHAGRRRHGARVRPVAARSAQAALARCRAVRSRNHCRGAI